MPRKEFPLQEVYFLCSSVCPSDIVHFVGRFYPWTTTTTTRFPVVPSTIHCQGLQFWGLVKHEQVDQRDAGSAKHISFVYFLGVDVMPNIPHPGCRLQGNRFIMDWSERFVIGTVHVPSIFIRSSQMDSPRWLCCTNLTALIPSDPCGLI